MPNKDSNDENLSDTPPEHARKFVEMLRSHYAGYHNHKEIMAHAAVLLQIGLFAGIISMKHWPPSWVQPIYCIPKEWVAFIGYLLMWLLVLLYVNWQLRKRKKAADKIREQIEQLKKWANPQSNKELDELFRKLMIQKAEDKGPIFPRWLIYIGTGLMLIAVLWRTILVTLGG